MADPRGGIRPTFATPGFEFALRGALGAAQLRLTEAGEVLATAAGIADGNFDSWFDGWTATADRVGAIAEGAEAKGRRASARDAWLRASYYHATAFFYVLGTRDPSRSKASFRAARDAFDRAMALWPTPVAAVAIPYSGTTLPGYWFSPGAEAADGPRPVIILNNGSDGQVVGMPRHGAVAAVERGWHALVFDGPGQGAAFYEQGLPFRPDWEAVISPVVDFVLAQPAVDASRVVLAGFSQGGYWAPRAAAFEHRLAALVADPGVMQVWTSWYDNLSPGVAEALATTPKAAFDAGVAEATATMPPSVRFDIAKRSEPYGTASLFEVLTQVRAYDLTGVAAGIRCPALVTDPEDEPFWPGQSAALHAALTCPKTLMPFTAAEGANGHCEPMAPGLLCQRMFDWLEETLDIA